MPTQLVLGIGRMGAGGAKVRHSKGSIVFVASVHKTDVALSFVTNCSSTDFALLLHTVAASHRECEGAEPFFLARKANTPLTSHAESADQGTLGSGVTRLTRHESKPKVKPEHHTPTMQRSPKNYHQHPRVTIQLCVSSKMDRNLDG